MRRPVLLAALTAVAVRALIVVKLPAPPIWHARVVVQLVEHLTRGEGLVGIAGGVSTGPSADHPVGYPALVALVARAGMSGLHAAWLINVVAAGLAAACAATLGHRIAGARGGYLAGMAYALAPGAALFSVAPLPETVAGAILAGAVAVAAAPTASLQARLVRSALAGALLGALALMQPHWLLAAPVLGALPSPGRWTRVASGAACLLAALLVVLPWTARNCVVLHGCALVSTGDGAQLYRGTIEVHAPADLAAAAPTACEGVPREVARDACYVRAARARIAAAPGPWLRLAVRRVYRALAAEWTPVNYVREAVPGATLGGSRVPGILVCSAWWWLLALGAVLGARRAVRVGGTARAQVGIAALLALLVALVAMLYSGGDAAHLALLPVLTPLTAGLLLPPRPPPEADLVWAA